mmetsp:Transcript_8995/g.24321  ORF Transcript_8995/g.24321 Transcript_8995/m.24321 type:complete len:231 (+) Transcript_8995:1507-2199(+)
MHLRGIPIEFAVRGRRQRHGQTLREAGRTPRNDDIGMAQDHHVHQPVLHMLQARRRRRLQELLVGALSERHARAILQSTLRVRHDGNIVWLQGRAQLPHDRDGVGRDKDDRRCHVELLRCHVAVHQVQDAPLHVAGPFGDVVDGSFLLDEITGFPVARTHVQSDHGRGVVRPPHVGIEGVHLVVVPESPSQSSVELGIRIEGMLRTFTVRTSIAHKLPESRCFVVDAQVE